MPVDLRARKLAQLAVRYSLKVKPGETVMIHGEEETIPFLVELYKEIVLRGGHPAVRFHLPNVTDFFYKELKNILEFIQILTQES
jgi:aminopeptidase